MLLVEHRRVTFSRLRLGSFARYNFVTYLLSHFRTYQWQAIVRLILPTSINTVHFHCSVRLSLLGL